MSALLVILYLIGAIGTCYLAHSVISSKARYRTGAAIAAAVLWPAIAALIIGFMVLDAAEWLRRQGKVLMAELLR